MNNRSLSSMLRSVLSARARSGGSSPSPNAALAVRAYASAARSAAISSPTVNVSNQPPCPSDRKLRCSAWPGGMGHGQALQRSFRSDGQGGWLLTFTVGDEIAADLAAEAYARTASAALGDGDLPALRDLALRTDRSIDDNERLFIAALLNPANAAQLHNEQPNAFAAHASVTFRGATITAENRERVQDYDGQAPTPIAL